MSHFMGIFHVCQTLQFFFKIENKNTIEKSLFKEKWFIQLKASGLSKAFLTKFVIALCKYNLFWNSTYVYLHYYRIIH